MRRSFTSLAAWSATFIVIVVGGVGFALPALYNIDSDMMFIAMPIAVVVVVSAAFAVLLKIIAAARRFGAKVEGSIQNL